MPGLRPSPPARLRAAVAVLAAVALGGLASPGAPAQTGSATTGAPKSDCFGAAARDAKKPCRDPKLRLRVFPLPEDALLEPNARCTPVGQTKVLLPCAFGVPKEKAKDVVALIGDSHASHWRAAVEGVAQARTWRGISITRSGCPFSKAVALLEGPNFTQCKAWNRDTLKWFTKHPEVHTVFVSQHRGGKVVKPAGASTQETQVQGYLDVWKALPDTVTRIFVIRDTPRASDGTPDCIQRAIAARRPAGPACALARGAVLKPDPAAIAVGRLGGKGRVRLIDLTSFVCSGRLCLPVIGGALVQKDVSHLTQTFAATLGPYMARKVAALGVPGAPE